ncbi:MAG: choice-of-anchor J domain-containing protein [Wenzhouxiangellaceae bacterium]|nr:choice-of-anchor J domain-containing protein [Wenzhouxiangellaceae bacterium]
MQKIRTNPLAMSPGRSIAEKIAGKFVGRRVATRATAAAIVMIASTGSAFAQDKIVLRGAELFDRGVASATVEVDMLALPKYPGWKPGDPIKEIPQRKGVPRDYLAPVTDSQPKAASALRDLNNRMPRLSGGAAFDTPLVNRDGGPFSGVNPPDTIGDIGLEHYIQMINGGGGVGGTRVLILDKTDGSTVVDFALGSLAEGSGTGCTSGSGDPIVMFDQSVDNGLDQAPGRWFLSEFTSQSFCVYISQTADPTTGAWFIYEFAAASGALPDYPKWAVWPDAYYIGANEDAGSIPGNGRTIYAFDRQSMLLGQTTRPAQVFEIPALAGFGFQMAQPADWDGLLPPPDGAPGLFLRHRDDEVHNAGSSDPSEDFLEIWEFSVDWDNQANSTFSGPDNIGVEDFESDLCGLTAFACVPQPNSSTELDPLREPAMWRAQYRNFGDRQTIVASWVSDVAGGNADLHGVRWAELRESLGAWSLFQEGTVAPDSVHRWMSSIAMDGDGNIAVGYNVSDGTATFPGLRYTGRLAADPLDTMPRGEVTLVDGSAANASNRYGDYASINVDPVDECTFWFTSQYNTSSQWSTRIGAFRFASCGTPGFVLGSSAPAAGVCTLAGTDQAAFDIDVLSVGGFFDPVLLEFNPVLEAGFGGIFNPNPVVPGNTASATVLVDQSVAAGVFDLNVLGTAAGADDNSLGLRLTVTDDLPGSFGLTAPADGAANAPFQPVLEWGASSQAVDYLVEVATDDAFANVIYSAIVQETTHQVGVPLDSASGFYWRITPTNFCGPGAASETFSFTTQAEPGDCSIGVATLNVFEDDMENGANGWTLGNGGLQNTWVQTTAVSVSGTTAWNAENLASESDQRLVSPAIQLPGSAQLPLTLRFQNRQEIEDDGGAACWDGAILEISTDNGASWQQIQSQVLFRDFDGTINTFAGGANPLAGSPAWCGDPRDWEDYVVDLSGFAGEQVQFRFRLGTDGTVGGREGWSIDDVRVEACGLEGIFADGFESPTLP